MTSLFIARRLLNYTILLFIAVSLVYLLAAVSLDPRSLYAERNPPIPPEQIENLLVSYNLSNNVPIFERYWNWLTGIVTSWDWGRAPTGASVNEQIGTRVWVSLRLVLIGSLLGVVIGVALGAWTAVRQYKTSDRVVTFASLVALAVPTLVIAVVLQIIAIRLNDAMGYRLFEFIGETGETGDYIGAKLVDRAQHLLLPSLTLVINAVASYSRIQRNLMLDSLGADYVRTARAKGLRRGVALRRHALRTALIPTATYFAFTVATLMVGSVFVEQVYGWHGMGTYAVSVISAQDVHGSAASAAFAGVCVLAGATLSDIFVAALDPRVRVS